MKTILADFQVLHLIYIKYIKELKVHHITEYQAI